MSSSNDDWFQSYIEQRKMIKELFDHSDSRSIYNNPKKANYINSINAIMMRIKTSIDELNYIDILYKLEKLDEIRLEKVKMTLENIEGALRDIRFNIGDNYRV